MSKVTKIHKQGLEAIERRKLHESVSAEQL